MAVWLAWQSADQSLAAVRWSAYWETLRKCNEAKNESLKGKHTLTEEEFQRLNGERSWSECEAAYQKTLGEQSTWKPFKAKITSPTIILLVEGTPVAAYLVCWAVVAGAVWVGRGFGIRASQSADPSTSSVSSSLTVGLQSGARFWFISLVPALIAGVLWHVGGAFGRTVVMASIVCLLVMLLLDKLFSRK